jgi:hypothetical protein
MPALNNSLTHNVAFTQRGLPESLGFAAILALAITTCAGIAFGAAQNTNAWEGEIEYPARPVVLTADFIAGTASLSGAAPVGLSRRSPIAGNTTVAFEVAVGPQRTLRFAGTRRDKKIAGLVDTGTGHFPFWLEKLPEIPSGRIGSQPGARISTPS